MLLFTIHFFCTSVCHVCLLFTLTLSLPLFWQFCSLGATFILTVRGIPENWAYKFSKIVIFLPFLSITFNKYPQYEVSKSRILWKLHNVCKQMDINKVRRGVLSRRLATWAVRELIIFTITLKPWEIACVASYFSEADSIDSKVNDLDHDLLHRRMTF